MSNLLTSIQRILPDPSAGLLAVSGGPDSVAMLLAVQQLYPDRPFAVAHLNHQLRGAESDADEQFVRELAHRLQYPCYVHSVDVAEQARINADNLENTARELRYRWLEQVALQHNFGWIATGHTADDQAETILHRLIRGTGLQGLRGIAMRRRFHPTCELVRPILLATRSDVMSYLQEKQQSYRQDSSNNDLEFTRNRIRRDLLPLLRSFNPAIVHNLNHLAEQAVELYQEQERLARQLLQAAEQEPLGSILRLELAPLQMAPRHHLRTLFRLIWQREGWPMRYLTFEHWDRLVDLVQGQVVAWDLPQGIRVQRHSKFIRLFRHTE